MNHNTLEALLLETGWTCVRKWGNDYAIYPNQQPNNATVAEMRAVLSLDGARVERASRFNELGFFQEGLVVTITPEP